MTTGTTTIALPDVTTAEQVHTDDVLVGDLLQSGARGRIDGPAFQEVKAKDVVGSMVTFTLVDGSFVCGELGSVEWRRIRPAAGSKGADRPVTKQGEPGMTTKTTTTEKVQPAQTELERLKALMAADPKKGRVEVLNACRAEAAAKKDAEKAGTEVPPTPVTDWTTSADYKAGANGRKKAAETRTGRPRGSATDGAVWYFNGAPIVRSRPYGFGYLAQQHGAGIDGPGPLSSERMREVVAALGVKDLTGKSWEVTLPNGHRIAYVLKGDPAPAPGAKEVPVPAAKAAAAKKAATAKPAPKPHAVSAPVAKGLTAASKAAAARKARPVTKAQQTRNNGKATAKKAS